MKLNLIVLLFLSQQVLAQSTKIKIDGKFVDTKVYFNLMSEPSIKWEVLNKSNTSLFSLKGNVDTYINN